MTFYPAAVTTSAAGFQAFQFQPETFGATRNGKIITDATIAGGALTTLTSVSANFTAADTGKHIVISGASSGAGGVLATTITFVNATTVTLANAASGAVTNVGAIYGTDDTAAWQSAVNAAATYAAIAPALYAEVVASPGIYCIAGAPVVGGSTAGNAQITLPVVSPSANYKITLALRGQQGSGAPGQMFNNTALGITGATLACMRTDGTYSGTNGPASVIGGPVNGYGGGGGTFSNVQMVVDNLTILVPPEPTYGGLMLYGMCQMKIGAFGYYSMSSATAGAWPVKAGATVNTFATGIVTPAVGNNVENTIEDYWSAGIWTGLCGADNLTVKNYVNDHCGNGWIPGGVSNFINHAATFLNWNCESTAPIFVFGAATWGGYNAGVRAVSVFIATLSLENYGTEILQGPDSGTVSRVQGTIWFEDLSSINPLPTYWASTQSTAVPPVVKILALAQSLGPVASPQAAPATTVAWNNFYYRDAEITLTVAGGTLTALSIDSTAQTVSGTPTFYRFSLPAGHAYTPTYTGTLTHTVTLK